LTGPNVTPFSQDWGGEEKKKKDLGRNHSAGWLTRPVKRENQTCCRTAGAEPPAWEKSYGKKKGGEERQRRKTDDQIEYASQKWTGGSKGGGRGERRNAEPLLRPILLRSRAREEREREGSEKGKSGGDKINQNKAV